MAYPNIKPQYGVKETSIGKVVRSEFNSNYSQQRLKTTRVRKAFELSYILSESDFNLLDTHFQDNLGISFSFTHPTTSTVYTVRYSDSNLEATYLYEDLIQVKVMLEEV